MGEAAWGYYELIVHRDAPFPSLADVGYLGAVPFGVVAIFLFRAAPSGAVSRARTVLDGLDDFGTGYSSLSYLQMSPIDVLKSDRSFVTQIDDAESAQPLLAAIVQLGHALGIRMVTKG